MADNRLTGLPEGVFAGLTGLTAVYLADNLRAIFTLTVRAKFDPPQPPDDFSNATITLTLREGAPRTIMAALSATGAGLSPAGPLTIPTGAAESDAFVTITRLAGSDSVRLTLDLIDSGGMDGDYSGFAIVPGAPITIGGDGGLRLRLRLFLEGALE